MTVIENLIDNLNARRIEKATALHWYQSLEETCADWGFSTIGECLNMMAWDELHHSKLLTAMIGTLEAKHGNAQPPLRSGNLAHHSMTRNPQTEAVVLMRKIGANPPNWVFWSEPVETSLSRATGSRHLQQIGSRWSNPANHQRSNPKGVTVRDIAEG
jgi:hypothetical protein